MAELDDEEFRAELWRRWVKGTLQSFVARGREPLGTVAAKVRTTLRRGNVKAYEVHQMLDDIEEESIEKMGSTSVPLGPRRERMVAIRRELSQRLDVPVV